MTLQAKYIQVLQNLPPVVTDSTANAGKRVYKYLSLNQLISLLHPVFQNAGCMFRQTVEYFGSDNGESRIVLVKTFIFDDDESMQVGEYPVMLSNDPQAVGSQVTYARRYSLYAAVDIYPEKDDDGAYAAQNRTPSITQAQAQQITDYCRAHNLTQQAFHIMTRALNRPIKRLTDIRPEEFDMVRAALTREGEQ